MFPDRAKWVPGAESIHHSLACLPSFANRVVSKHAPRRSCKPVLVVPAA